MKKCPVCKGRVDVRREDRELTLQGRTVNVAQEFFWCAECEAEHMTPEMLDAALRRAVELIRKQDSLLSADEIKQLRTSLGYTQIEFEAILGSGPKTVTRWERGTVAPSGAANRLLELFKEHPDLAHNIAVRIGVRASNRVASAWSGVVYGTFRRLGPPVRPEARPQRKCGFADLGQLIESWEHDAGAETVEVFPHKGPRWEQRAPLQRI